MLSSALAMAPRSVAFPVLCRFAVNTEQRQKCAFLGAVTFRPVF